MGSLVTLVGCDKEPLDDHLDVAINDQVQEADGGWLDISSVGEALYAELNEDVPLTGLAPSAQNLLLRGRSRDLTRDSLIGLLLGQFSDRDSVRAFLRETGRPVWRYALYAGEETGVDAVTVLPMAKNGELSGYLFVTRDSLGSPNSLVDFIDANYLAAAYSEAVGVLSDSTAALDYSYNDLTYLMALSDPYIAAEFMLYDRVANDAILYASQINELREAGVLAPRSCRQVRSRVCYSGPPVTFRLPADTVIQLIGADRSVLVSRRNCVTVISYACDNPHGPLSGDPYPPPTTGGPIGGSGSGGSAGSGGGGVGGRGTGGPSGGGLGTNPGTPPGTTHGEEGGVNEIPAVGTVTWRGTVEDYEAGESVRRIGEELLPNAVWPDQSRLPLSAAMAAAESSVIAFNANRTPVNQVLNVPSVFSRMMIAASLAENYLKYNTNVSDEQRMAIVNSSAGLMVGEATSALVTQFETSSLFTGTAYGLGPILGLMVGVIIEQSGNPESFAYLGNRMMAGAFESSLHQALRHYHQQEAVRRRLDRLYLKSRAVIAYRITQNTTIYDMQRRPISVSAGDVIYPNHPGYNSARLSSGNRGIVSAASIEVFVAERG